MSVSRSVPLLCSPFPEMFINYNVLLWSQTAEEDGPQRNELVTAALKLMKHGCVKVSQKALVSRL